LIDEWHTILKVVNMKVIGNRFVLVLAVWASLVFASLLLAGCSTRNESSKDAAEEENSEKFSTKNGEQDAQFLVNAVDNSFTIINLAKLAEERGTKETAARASQIIAEQRKIMSTLEDYASKQVISIPESGPEKISNIQKNLYDEHKDFDKKWCEEITAQNKIMLNAFEEYSEKTEGDLKNIITEVLPTLRSQQDKLQAYKLAVND
jgi:predicted outer membrane protein